jgi:hypothetical protein
VVKGCLRDKCTEKEWQNLVSNFRWFILRGLEHVANKAEIGYMRKNPYIRYVTLQSFHTTRWKRMSIKFLIDLKHVLYCLWASTPVHPVHELKMIITTDIFIAMQFCTLLLNLYFFKTHEWQPSLFIYAIFIHVEKITYTVLQKV